MQNIQYLLPDKIGKGKKFDECKILALQDHCFLSKLYGEDGALTVIFENSIN